MTTDELKTEILSGINGALDSFVFSKFISTEQKKLMRAQRDFWLNADEATLQKALKYYNAEP